MGTILVGAITLGIILAAAYSVRKSKKSGGCSGCSGCSASSNTNPGSSSCNGSCG